MPKWAPWVAIGVVILFLSNWQTKRNWDQWGGGVNAPSVSPVPYGPSPTAALYAPALAQPQPVQVPIGPDGIPETTDRPLADAMLPTVPGDDPYWMPGEVYAL